jgi:hypothetical protein
LRVVTLDSKPGSAQVFRNGAEVGMTPLDIAVPAGSPVLVTLRKRGFADHSVELVAQDGRKSVTLSPLPQPVQPARAAPPKRERERERKTRPQQAPAISARSPQAPAPPTNSPYEKF